MKSFIFELNYDEMKQLLLLLAVVVSTTTYSQTPITDANFQVAINTCLSTNPIDGMCSSSEYGAMPDWDVSNVTNMERTHDLCAFAAPTDAPIKTQRAVLPSGGPGKEDEFLRQVLRLHPLFGIGRRIESIDLDTKTVDEVEIKLYVIAHSERIDYRVSTQFLVDEGPL